MNIVSTSFSGTIDSSVDPTFVVGDTVSGTLTYDSTQPGGTGGDGIYTFTGSQKAHTAKFNVHNSAGVQVGGDSYAGMNYFFQAVVTYNTTYKGQTGTLAVFKMTTIGGRNFQLTLFDRNNVGVTNNALPTTSNIGNFNSGSCSVEFARAFISPRAGFVEKVKRLWILLRK
jgi:hypothetical protein